MNIMSEEKGVVIDAKHMELIKSSKKIHEPIFTEVQLQAIFAPTPKKYVKNRKGRGGKQFAYVDGQYVRNRLNQIFGWSWSWEVLDKFRDGDEVVVQGRLSIKNREGVVLITKEDFGCKEIQYLNDKNKNKTDKPVSVGNDYKAATTDSMKRCARQIGIASDVYGDDFKTSNDVSNIVYEEGKEDQVRMVIDTMNATKTVEELEDAALAAGTLLKDKRVVEVLNKRKKDLCES